MDSQLLLPGSSERTAEVFFVVLGEPIAQPRVKARVVGRGAKQFVQMYVDGKHPVHAYRKSIAAGCQCCMLQRDNQPLDGPVHLEVLCVMERPSHKVWKTKPMPSYPHTSKPDASNILKAIEDALTGIAYVDDSQIVSLRVEKRVAAGGEPARTEVLIYQTEF